MIHLFMAGAPSQLDLFDSKPALTKLEGKPLPPSVIGGQRYAFIRPDAAVLGPRFKFARYGQSGAELSEMLPHLAQVVDEIAIIKSVHTDQFNHAPAQIFFNTGFSQPGRPSLGSWVIYGLGSEAQDLPAFVVMSTGSGISGGSANWSSGFLPTIYTGVRLRNQGDPILNVSSPPGVDAKLQRDSLDLLGSLNSRRLEAVGDPEIATRIASYEMAFRLQTSAPELMDLKSESKATLAMYGADPDKPSFARACLLARRMIERGVRFVNIYHEGWDAHTDVAGNLRTNCGATDQAAAALDHGPQAARAARRHAGDLGRRVRPHADGRNQRRPGPQPGPRPPSAGLHDVDGRRRHQARHDLRRHRRPGLSHRREPRARPRPPGDDPAPPRLRPREAHLPPRRPRLPAHRRAREGRQGNPGVSQVRDRLLNVQRPLMVAIARSRNGRSYTFAQSRSRPRIIPTATTNIRGPMGGAATCEPKERKSVGRFSVEIEIANNDDLALVRRGLLPADQVRREMIQGVVDSGATRLVLPEAS